MGVIDRNFRLTNEPGGLGVSCTASGLSLAGVPLLSKSGGSFAPRSPEEIETLVKAAYGAEISVAELLPGFDAVARALNRGDLAHAMTVAVLTRLPELDWNGAVKLANAERRLRKYNPDQPRDWHGRWTDDGGADMSGQDRLPQYPADIDPEQGASSAQQNDTFDDDEGGEAPDNRPPLEREYDDLGPVAFARQVTQFGDQLARQGKNLTPEEQQSARAEYDFLQSRLSFWLGIENKPFEAQANLLSAAQTLYEGAINSGVISMHDGFPPSMLDVGLSVIGLDNHQPDVPLRASSSIGPVFEGEAVPVQERSLGALSDVAEAGPSGKVGDVIDGAKAEIDFDGGIADKGIPLEGYVASQIPGVRVLKPGSKTFDLFDDSSSQAISVKVLDPLSYGYINNPQRIYGRLKSYVDAAANYNKPRTKFDLDPSRINSRIVHLGVRDYVSPAQWRQLNRAVMYGKSRGVSLVITRIR